MTGLIYYFGPLYVSVTMAAYIFGPWPFPRIEDWFGFYLLCCVSSLFLGVFVGRRLDLPSAAQKHSIVRFDTVFKTALFVSLLLTLPTTYARTGHFFPDFLFGLYNPAEAYARSTVAEQPVLEYIRIALAPLLMCVIPFGVDYWGALSARVRFFYGILIFHTILLFVAMGVNRGIFDLIAGIAFVYFISRSFNARRNRPFRGIFLLVILFLALLFGGVFFAYGQMHREGSGAPIGYLPSADIYSALDPRDPDSIVAKYFFVLINQSTSYLAQGYYGASLAFAQGIDDLMFGFGHSDFLFRNIVKVSELGDLAGPVIYVVERDNGWLHGNYWFSIIPWIASDVGFSGVPLVLFGLSALYATCLRAYLARRDRLSLLVVYCLFFMFAYFPANNYIVQSGEGFVSAYFVIVTWIIRELVYSANKHKLGVLNANRMG